MPTSIKNVLQGLFNTEMNSAISTQPTLTAQTWQTRLITEWPHVVGALHEHMRLEKIQGTTLIIGVFHASWLQELYLLTPMLIKTINEYLGSAEITHIRCKAAARKHSIITEAPGGATRGNASVGGSSREERPRNEILSPRQLSPKEQQALANVEDPQLRSMLQTLLYVGESSCGKKIKAKP